MMEQGKGATSLGGPPIRPLPEQRVAVVRIHS